MKSKREILDDYIIQLLTSSGLEGDELTKHLIICKTFMNETASCTNKMSSVDLKKLMNKFILFVLQFETICIRAYKPSGSQSTAKDIIRMYSSRSLNASFFTEIKSLNNGKES